MTYNKTNNIISNVYICHSISIGHNISQIAHVPVRIPRSAMLLGFRVEMAEGGCAWVGAQLVDVESVRAGA